MTINQISLCGYLSDRGLKIYQQTLYSRSKFLPLPLEYKVLECGTNLAKYIFR